MKELEQLRALYLGEDVDPVDRADNERRIHEWEQALLQSGDYLAWREHPVTRQIAQKAKDEYKNTVMQLGTRQFEPAMRDRLFALQDAAKWVLGLAEQDAKGTIEHIHQEIRAALNNA